MDSASRRTPSATARVATTFAVLQHPGYPKDQSVAFLPPILRDPISTDFLLSFDPKHRDDLLAHDTATLDGRL